MKTGAEEPSGYGGYMVVRFASGAISCLRALRPRKVVPSELVHRLDVDTPGVLHIGMKRSCCVFRGRLNYAVRCKIYLSAGVRGISKQSHAEERLPTVTIEKYSGKGRTHRSA